MTTLLQINASINNHNGQSSQLANQFVAAFHKSHPKARIVKRDVAADLPEKIEQVSYCELNDGQRSLYQQVLDASRREILDAVNANGLAKSRMLVLTALLRLRQICCDMRLLESKLANTRDLVAKKIGRGDPLTAILGDLISTTLTIELSDDVGAVAAKRLSSAIVDLLVSVYDLRRENAPDLGCRTQSRN